MIDRWLPPALTLVGAVMLCVALFPLKRIVDDLPNGRPRTIWKLLGASGPVFAIGYVSVALGGFGASSPIVVSAILLLGAMFVLIVAHVSLETVHVIRRVANLEVESITDPLMQIRNRRYLDSRLREEFARSRRYGLPLSVLMIDVDHFKQINDTHGHVIGDRVLVRLGALLRRIVRESDVVARFGGEEVVVLATGTDAVGARTLAERLRSAVEGEAPPSGEPRCTVSIGVAALDAATAKVEELLVRADQALYAAKQAGRNRVAASPREVTPVREADVRSA